MVAKGISSPGELAQFLSRHGEGEGHRVRFRKSFSLPLSDVPETVMALERKVKEKGWRVDDAVYLQPLIGIDGELREADVLLGELIALTEPGVDTTHRRSRRHVGLPLRIVGLGATAAQHRNGHASASGRNGRAAFPIGLSVPVDGHASASGPVSNGRANLTGISLPIDDHASASGSRRNGRAALTTGFSLPVDGHASASGSRRNDRATLIIGPSNPIDSHASASAPGPRRRYAKRRRAGRRHRLPRIVPPAKAEELLEAGNRLQGCHLLRAQDIGEALAAVGLSLLRQKKDRATLHSELLRVKDQLMDARAADVRLGDLK